MLVNNQACIIPAFLVVLGPTNQGQDQSPASALALKIMSLSAPRKKLPTANNLSLG
jgi:hypothetical protein